MKALKHFALIIAAATLLLSCDKQEEPMGGGTGTVTPVDDPTKPGDPDDGMRIVYQRTDSLQYSFFGYGSIEGTLHYTWTIEDPGLEKPYQVDQNALGEIHYTFHAPGQAKVTLSALVAGPRDTETISTSINVNVH